MASRIDWQAIETDYRIGQITRKQICEKHEISQAGLTKRVKAEGWTRDLGVAVRLATKAKVREDVIAQWQESSNEMAIATSSEINLAASANALLIAKHRKDLNQLQILLDKNLAQLEEATDAVDDLKRITIMVSEQDPGAVAAILKFVNVTTRIDAIKKAAETQSRIINSERQAYGIDEKQDAKPEVEEVLRQIVNS